MRRRKNVHRPTMKSRGMTQPMTSDSQRLAISPVYLTPCASSSSGSLASVTLIAEKGLPFCSLPAGLKVPYRRSSERVTSWTRPWRTYILKSEYEIVSPFASFMKKACASASRSRNPRTYQTAPPKGRAVRRSPGRRFTGAR
jgi:hypothetical protein